MPPLVSVVTPSFQQGRYIERTLESVAGQTYAGGIEHIVMDGGSTDGTVSILERWRHRISFVSERDGGQAAATNSGFVKSRGEILSYLNSDDVYERGAVAAAVEAFDRDPAIDVVYGDADYIDVDDRVIKPYPTEPWSLERLKLICFLCQPAVFIRRRVIERFGLFDPRFDNCMDYEYWLRLALGGARFRHIPIKMASFRLHREGKTTRVTQQAHNEINDMLLERLGAVPESWLLNYAYASLDARGVARSSDVSYLTRVAMRTIGAAIRWNRYPSIALLRQIAWSFRHPSTEKSVVEITLSR